MANRNTSKLAVIVLLLSIGATAYAITKSLSVVALQHRAPVILEATERPLPSDESATEGLQNNRNTSASDFSTAAYEEDVTLSEVRTIAAVTKSERNFSVLAVALEAAGLTDMLSEEGPFTIFAPTDDAFYALPAGQLEALLQAENRDQLIALLTHHVVEGTVLSSDFKSGEIDTVDNDTLKVSLEGNVEVDGAQVVESDIPASNGVIHAVDSVIVPEQAYSASSYAGQSS